MFVFSLLQCDSIGQKHEGQTSFNTVQQRDHLHLIRRPFPMIARCCWGILMTLQNEKHIYLLGKKEKSIAYTRIAKLSIRK